MRKKIIKILALSLVSITLGISAFGNKAMAATSASSTGNLDGSSCSAKLYTIASEQTVEGDLSCSGAILKISVTNYRHLGDSYRTYYGSGTGSYTGGYSAYATNNWGGSVFVSGTGSFTATKPTGSKWVRNLSISK